MSFAEKCRRVPFRNAWQVFLWWVLVRGTIQIILTIVHRYRCYGKENLPQQGPAVICSNHQSHLDPPIIGVGTEGFASLAREGLFKSKFWDWVLQGLGSIPLDQSKGDAAALKVAVGVLKDGGRMLIFPEGSRSPDGALTEFKAGVMLLVRRAKVPVIPVAVEGVHDVWPIGSKPTMRGRVAMKIGKPIPAEELLAVHVSEAIERIKREIETMRMELREELRRKTKGRFPAPGPGDVPYWEREKDHVTHQVTPGAQDSETNG